MALCASASRCMAFRISTGCTTPLNTLAKAPSTRPSNRFSKRCSTLTGSSSASEDMMVSGRRSRIFSLQPPALLDPRMTPVDAVLVFPGAAGVNKLLGDVRQRSLSQPVTRSWPSSQLCHGDVAEWQTRTVQVRVSERTWGFNSPHPHRVHGPLSAESADRGPPSYLLRGPSPLKPPRCVTSRWLGGCSWWPEPAVPYVTPGGF